MLSESRTTDLVQESRLYRWLLRGQYPHTGQLSHSFCTLLLSPRGDVSCRGRGMLLLPTKEAVKAQDLDFQSDDQLPGDCDSPVLLQHVHLAGLQVFSDLLSADSVLSDLPSVPFLRHADLPEAVGQLSDRKAIDSDIRGVYFRLLWSGRLLDDFLH